MFRVLHDINSSCLIKAHVPADFSNDGTIICKSHTVVYTSTVTYLIFIVDTAVRDTWTTGNSNRHQTCVKETWFHHLDKSMKTHKMQCLWKKHRFQTYPHILCCVQYPLMPSVNSNFENFHQHLWLPNLYHFHIRNAHPSDSAVLKLWSKHAATEPMKTGIALKSNYL